ncbi:MAG: hypothetical protein JSV44_03475, partial [Candidatus Zixiibacteriota bacterium]
VESSGSARYLPGILLIIIGAIFMMNEAFWWFDFRDLWPLLLIALGLFLLFRANDRKELNRGSTAPEEVRQ